MTRFLLAAAATLIAAPAVASTYSATPATAPTFSKVTAKDVRWSCADGTCQGATDLSRPLIICQDLAKKAGRIDKFVADGRAFGGDDLAKCNKDAKGGSAIANAN